MTTNRVRPTRRKSLAVSVTATLLLGAVSGQSKARHRILTIDGDQPDSRFGYYAATIGDIDQDGVPDLVASADWGGPTNREGTVFVFSGRSGKQLYRFEGDDPNDRLGTSVAGVGDIDKDGYPDIAAGAHWDDNNGTNSGMVRFFSGKDGSIIRSVDGHQAGARLGENMDGGGDVDNDGYPDLVVGARDDGVTTSSKEGAVVVLSGKDGSVIYRLLGDNPNDKLGNSVCMIGDLNADGHAEFAGGSHVADNVNVPDTGLVRIFNGKDGTVLKDLYGPTTDIRQGGRIDAGDINQDSFADIIIHTVKDKHPNSTINNGSVRVISGIWIILNIGPEELYKWRGSSTTTGFGNRCAFGGDVNNDGFGDVLVTQTSVNSGTGEVTIFSGQDGTVIGKFEGDSTGDNFGVSLCTAGDLNGDGYADFHCGAMWDDNFANNAGSLTMMSGKELTMVSDIHSFSLAAANTQTLSIDVGATHAGRTYWTLGSVTGTSPGITLFGVNIPLNPDPWTDLTIALTNSPTLVTSRGTLDAQGQGSTQIMAGADQLAEPGGHGPRPRRDRHGWLGSHSRRDQRGDPTDRQVGSPQSPRSIATVPPAAYPIRAKSTRLQ